MFENYENRVKNFIMDMTNPKSKITINDVTKKVDTSRKEFLYSFNKKPFIFKGYKNEIDRINATIKDNSYYFNMPDYEKIKKEKKIKSLSPSNHKIHNLKKNIVTLSPKNIQHKFIVKDKNNINNMKAQSSNDIFNETKNSFSRNISNLNKQKYEYYIKNNIILQPLMRFKPRTDLERVYDTLNRFHIDKNDNKIIERQLKHINLYGYKKPDELFKDSECNNSNVIQRNPYLIINNKEEQKTIKNDDLKHKFWKRSSELNKEAENLLKSYHYKTHFKAAEEIAGDKNKIKRFYKKTIKNNMSKTIFSYSHLDNSNINNINENISFHYNNNSADEEVSDSEWEFFENKLNKSPIIESKRKKIMPLNHKTIKIIEKMAFEKKIKKQPNDKNDKKETIINLKESNINDIYNKKEQFNMLIKNVLKDCHYLNNKSKNNNSSLKVRNGKTMITRGLSIAQFEKKYKLHE